MRTQQHLVPPDLAEVDEPALPPEHRPWRWGVCLRITSSKWWHASYVSDYAAVVVCLLGALATYVAVPPFERPVPGGLSNTAHAYPFKRSSIGSVEVFLAYVGAAALVVGLCQYFVRSAHDLHAIVLSCVTSLSLSVLSYAVLIKIAGRHRPNFFARLDEPYDEGTYRMTRERWDLHQSWPSGHAQNSQAVLFTLSLYLLGKLRAMAPHQGQVWKVCVAMLPTVGAWVIGASRTSDFYHDFDDVGAGLVFGTFAASLSYFSQYPSLFDTRAHRPRVRCLMEFERYAAAHGTALMAEQSEVNFGPTAVEV